MCCYREINANDKLMKNRPTLLIIFAMLVLSSCSAVRVTTRGAVPVTTVEAEDERKKTVHVFLGTEKTWEEDLCDRAPLAQVTVQPNFLYSLVHVATLGIWAPVKVSYKCNETCDN